MPSWNGSVGQRVALCTERLPVDSWSGHTHRLQVQSLSKHLQKAANGRLFPCLSPSFLSPSCLFFFLFLLLLLLPLSLCLSVSPPPRPWPSSLSKNVLMISFMIISHTFERRRVKEKPRGHFCHTSLISESKNKKGETQVTGHERRQTPGCFIHFYYWFTVSLILFLNACLGQKVREHGLPAISDSPFLILWGYRKQSQNQGYLRAF